MNKKQLIGVIGRSGSGSHPPMPEHVLKELTGLLLAFKQIADHAKEMRDQQQEFPSPVNSVLSECASRNVLLALDKLLENIDFIMKRNHINKRRCEPWIKEKILNLYSEAY